VGRFTDAPMDTVMFLVPFFLEVNLMALVIRFTRTRKDQREPKYTGIFRTLLHAIEVSNNSIYVLLLIRNVHSVMKVDVFGFELRLEDSKRLGELPLWSCFLDGSVKDAK
jgi:hypothetical protein